MKKHIFYFPKMKRVPLCFVSLFIFHISVCHAQDTIVLLNGQKLACKVMYTEPNITYTIPPSGKENMVMLGQVNYIKYHDGSIYTINQQAPPTKSGPDKSEINESAYKVFSITTDLAQYILIQPNIGIEFRIISNLNIGVNFGLVNTSPMFEVNPLANGQFTNPGTVYSGYAVRVYAKFFLSDKHKGYLCLQGAFKSLTINNVTMFDQYGDAYSNTYTINESTETTGIDLFHGFEITKNNSMAQFDLFYGFGIHGRHRNYTISNQQFGNFGQPPLYESNGHPIAYDGNYSELLTIFTPVIGLRVGFSYVKKK